MVSVNVLPMPTYPMCNGPHFMFCTNAHESTNATSGTIDQDKKTKNGTVRQLFLPKESRNSGAGSYEDMNAGVRKNRSRSLVENCNEDLTRNKTAKIVSSVPVSSSAFHFEYNIGRRELLFMPPDKLLLSAYQCHIRQQIELFETTPSDLEANGRGRYKAIDVGQVGIRCIHCKDNPYRRPGAIFYPRNLGSIYKAAQCIANRHLHFCLKHLRMEKQSTKTKSFSGGGWKYWSDAARAKGVYETEKGLRFHSKK
eukprot:jgi/Psemu1/301883/fgenesh1_kg.50_\